jgi:archaellum component FlaC
LTVKDLPEAVRSLQYRYETDIFRLSKKIENLNKLEQKVDDFVTVTRDYFKDQMDVQLERQAEMTFEIAQARADASGTKEQVAELMKELKEIKEEIPEMRTEINQLTSSFNDLTAKVDMCLTGIWDNTEEPFVVYQRRKNRELDEDIQDIGSQTEDQNRQITFLRRMFIQVQMAFDVLRHEHGIQLSEDVKKILPPNPLPAHDTVPATGTVRSLASFGSGANPAAKTDVAAKAGPPAQTSPPAKATPASTTAPASASASATVTPPGSSTAKQSSIPRRSKKKSSKKNSSSSAAQQTSAAKTEEVPAVPTLPEGIRVPRDAVSETPVPLADIHPLFRPQFNEVNAPGIPTAGVPTAEPSGRVSPVEAGKDAARK